MALDAADLKAIQDLITASTTATTEASAKQVKEAIAALDLDNKLAALKPPAPAAPPADDAKAPADDANPELARMKARMEEMARKQEEAIGRATEAEKRAKTDAMLRAFDSAAATAGVPADRLATLRALVHNAEGRIGYDDGGQMGMDFQRNGYTDHLPFDKGLAEYLSTPAGKQFLPPTNIAGTGDKPSGNSTLLSSGGEIDADSLLDNLFGALTASN